MLPSMVRVTQNHVAKPLFQSHDKLLCNNMTNTNFVHSSLFRRTDAR